MNGEYENLSNEQLVSLYKKGDTTALGILLNRIIPIITECVERIILDKECSKDYVQDVLLKVITNIDTNKYKEKGKFLSWLKRITKNLVGDDLRHKKRTNTEYYIDISNYEYLHSTNEEEQLIEDCIIVLNKFVTLLPEEQKEILHLRYKEGLSFKEISERLNISINTALGRHRYAIERLRKLYNKYQIL